MPQEPSAPTKKEGETPLRGKGRPNLGGPAQASKRYYSRAKALTNTRTLLRRAHQTAKGLLEQEPSQEAAKAHLDRTTRELLMAYDWTAVQEEMDIIQVGYTAATRLMKQADYFEVNRENDKRNDWWQPLSTALDDVYTTHHPDQLLPFKSAQHTSSLLDHQSLGIDHSSLGLEGTGHEDDSLTVTVDDDKLAAISQELQRLHALKAARLNALKTAAAAVAEAEAAAAAAASSSSSSAASTSPAITASIAPLNHTQMMPMLTASSLEPKPGSLDLDAPTSSPPQAPVAPSVPSPTSASAITHPDHRNLAQFGDWIDRKPKYRKKLLVSFFYYALAHAHPHPRVAPTDVPFMPITGLATSASASASASSPAASSSLPPSEHPTTPPPPMTASTNHDDSMLIDQPLSPHAPTHNNQTEDDTATMHSLLLPHSTSAMAQPPEHLKDVHDIR